MRSKIFRNFFVLQRALDSEFFRGVVRAPTFFGHAKFEVKNFSEFFHLQSALDSEFVREGVSGYQLFLVMLNLRSKIFWNFFVYR